MLVRGKDQSNGTDNKLPRLAQEVDYLQGVIKDKEQALSRARGDLTVLEEQMARMQTELDHFKENYQQLSYAHLERGD